MALVQRHIRETYYRDGDITDTSRAVDNPVADRPHRTNVAERVVWYIAGILLTLLALRFLFALLGANPSNGLADFIYSVTYPFVAPFFNLFNYSFTAGTSRFETYTLVAMLIYGLVAWGIARLVTIRRY